MSSGMSSDYPLPAKNLYLVRVLLLVLPSLTTVYYFIRVAFPDWLRCRWSIW